MILSYAYLDMAAINDFDDVIKPNVSNIGTSLKKCLFAISLPCIFWLGRYVGKMFHFFFFQFDEKMAIFWWKLGNSIWFFRCAQIKFGYGSG